MRISNLHVKNTQVFNLMRNNTQALKAQKQLLTSKQFSQPSEAPRKTITSLYTRIRTNQLERYETNNEEALTRLDLGHDKLTSANNLIRRVRELAVQAANGTLTPADRRVMATEVEEMLQELVAISNSEYEDQYIFAGSKKRIQPFTVSTAFNNDLGKTIIENVSYNGDYHHDVIRVGDHDDVTIPNNGSSIFWADRPTIIPRTDSRNFVTAETATIRIDGYDVQLAAGDNLPIIIEKINSQVPSATAFIQELPTGEQVMGIEANYPHQLALEDVAGGNILRTLGFLKVGAPGNVPYENLRSNVIADDASVFERIILLRNALIDNEVRDIGGIHLGGVSRSLENVVKNQADFSALATRLKSVRLDLSAEKQNIIERRSQVEDTDIAAASIEFNEWNYLHRISLQTASRLLAPTLLDFT